MVYFRTHHEEPAFWGTGACPKDCRGTFETPGSQARLYYSSHIASELAGCIMCIGIEDVRVLSLARRRGGPAFVCRVGDW